MPLVEPDGPLRGCPCPYQQRPSRLGRESCQQRTADSVALMGRPNIRVADQRDLAHVLKPHHTHQNPRVIPAPELDAPGNFSNEVGALHIRFVPTVGRDDSAVGTCCLVDDCVYRWNVVSGTAPDHRTLSSRCGGEPRRLPRTLGEGPQPDKSSVTSALVNFVVSGAWPCSKRKVTAPPNASMTKSMSVPARSSPREIARRSTRRVTSLRRSANSARNAVRVAGLTCASAISPMKAGPATVRVCRRTTVLAMCRRSLATVPVSGSRNSRPATSRYTSMHNAALVGQRR